MSRLVFGLMLLVVGALFLLRRYHEFNVGSILRLWPTALIVIGFVRLLRAGTAWRASGALLWLGIGSWFLLGNLGILHASPLELWPLVFVLVGWRVFAGARSQSSSGEPFRAAAFMGAQERAIHGALAHGDAIAVMGACKIDLSTVRASGETVEIEALAFWGGIELIVPREWAVEARALPVLGSIEDKTEPLGLTSTTLVVRGLAVMGGVEIRNPKV